MSCCNHYLCHVRYLLLKRRFLNFGRLGVVTRRWRGVIYTPSRVCPGITLTGRPSAPWVPAVPALTLFVKACGSNQGKIAEQTFSNIRIYKINSCFFYRSVRFTIHIAQYIYRLIVHIAHSHIFMLFVRAVNTFLSLFYLMSRNLEAIHRTLARSAPSSAVVHPAVALLAPVLFLQVRMLLLRQISGSHWFQFDCLGD